MTTKTWKLTDVASGTYIDQLTVGPEDVGGPADGYSIVKRRLHGGLSDGIDHIRVDNGLFSFEVLPTRGMGIWKGWLGGTEIGWQSPVGGPVHPQYVPVTESSGLGWLDGFDEWFVRCGLESNGAPDFDEKGGLLYPLHGKIQNRPGHRVDVSVDGETGEITIVGVVEESRFHFSHLRLTTTIKTRVGQPGLSVHDRIDNLGASPAGMQMLYHINFGKPLLEAGSQMIAPLKTVVPRNAHAAEGIGNWNGYSGEQAGFEEQVYFLELEGDTDGRTETLLKDAHASKGVSLHFNKNQLPCFSLWKDTGSASDGYVTGLEPGTNFPNPRSYEKEQGRVVDLPPGGHFSFDMGIEVHGTAAAVETAEARIAAIQGDTKPRIYDSPQKGWTTD